MEIVENDQSGLAVVKLYGPNAKKENVVMVTKSKESESKYVKNLLRR